MRLEASQYRGTAARVPKVPGAFGARPLPKPNARNWAGERKGVGEMVSMKDLQRTPEKLIQVVHRVAKTATYALNAQKIKEILDKLKPSEKAADLIEKHFDR